MSRGVQGDLFFAVNDPEVGVLDDDVDGLAGVVTPDPESLTSDHGDAVGGDSAPDPDRGGRG